jgi:hypothetical protein
MDPKHKDEPWVDRDEDEGYDGNSADDGEEMDGGENPCSTTTPRPPPTLPYRRDIYL